MRRIHDRVHGDVVLTGLVARVVDEPELHRLDMVRQLGGCAFVYPSATHARREHSIGVGHLAGCMGRHLQTFRPDLVDGSDIECLQLAGLLHDVGHGPFSHLFEELVRETVDSQWDHESMGTAIATVLLRRVGAGEDTIAFVNLLVHGLDANAPWPDETGGRAEHKRFLVDVVHNRTCGIDVDKIDYLLRDALAVFGATHAVDAARIIDGARVSKDGAHLYFDTRVALSVEQIFELRTRLHRQVYQHREVLVVEHLLKEVLRARGDAWVRAQIESVGAFLRLNDATVLNGMTDLERARLHAVPRMHHVAQAQLETRPACTHCGHATEVEHAFCTQCGMSTATRAGAATTFLMLHEGLLVPHACVVTGGELAARINDICDRTDVRVFISSVHVGVPRVVCDPYGYAWREYKVVGAARRTRGMLRTAHCYVSSSLTDEDEGVRLSEAFEAVVKKMVVQE